MTGHSFSFSTSSADETRTLAQSLAPHLTGGDTLLLVGDVGAGKTHFARSLIQMLIGQTEDVPSPTFTLVQTYPCADAEIWHADLYRLTSTLEIEELGLVDAFDTEICLVEWPDRLGPLMPHHALTLTFASGAHEDARQITVSWTATRWTALLYQWNG